MIETTVKQKPNIVRNDLTDKGLQGHISYPNYCLLHRSTWNHYLVRFIHAHMSVHVFKVQFAYILSDLHESLQGR